MANAVQMESTTETTDIPLIVRCAIILGVIQSVIVLVVSLVNRSLAGTADVAITALLVIIGTALCILLPGIWTRARTIEGISGAAGIGLGAALTFLLIDVILLQNIGTYTNRWWEVGGHSNWWYHPVWWMVSAYLSWMGAWILANQAARRGAASPMGAGLLVAVLAAALGALGATLGFPGASFNVATFAVAVLPALALGTLISGFGAAQR